MVTLLDLKTSKKSGSNKQSQEIPIHPTKLVVVQLALTDENVSTGKGIGSANIARLVGKLSKDKIQDVIT